MENQPTIPQAAGAPDGPKPPSSLANPNHVIQPLTAVDQQTPPPPPPTPPPSMATPPHIISAQPPAPNSIVTSPSTDASQTVATTPMLVGSQLQAEKKKLPIGLYIIIGYSIIGFAAGFFDTSQNSLIYTMALLLELVMVVGLMLRQEAARKAVIWISGIIVVLSIVGIVLLTLVQHNLHDLHLRYNTAVTHIDPRKITLTEKKQLAALTTQIAQQEKQIGKVVTYTYIRLGAEIIGNTVMIIYLTRPKVKEIFEKPHATL